MKTWNLDPWVEPLLRAYLSETDLPREEVLQYWVQLQNESPLLCGEMPPIRWVAPIVQWSLWVRSEDQTFFPVAYYTPANLVDAFQAGEQWVQMYFTSVYPEDISTEYRQFVEDLMSEAVTSLQKVFDVKRQQ